MLGPFRKFLILLLILPLAGVFALDFQHMFRESPDHYIVQVDKSTRINWTAGFILARVEEQLPRIILDSKHPDFGKHDTVMSISAARTRAREAARDKASLKIMRVLGRMRLDSSFTLLEKMHKNRGLRERLGIIPERFVVKSRTTGEGFVSLELAMPFYTEIGLYEMVAGSGNSREKMPVSEGEQIQDRITGLIIDVSEFPGFEPALEPSIYSDQGRRIYSRDLVGRRCVIRRGLSTYYTSIEQARQSRKLGSAPYLTYAAGIRGQNRTDVYLDSREVSRILGSKTGRKALRNCRVAFVVRKK